MKVLRSAVDTIKFAVTDRVTSAVLLTAALVGFASDSLSWGIAAMMGLIAIDTIAEDKRRP